MVMILMNEKVDPCVLDKEFTKIPNAVKSSWFTQTKGVISKNGFYNRLVTFAKDAVTDE